MTTCTIKKASLRKQFALFRKKKVLLRSNQGQWDGRSKERNVVRNNRSTQNLRNETEVEASFDSRYKCGELLANTVMNLKVSQKAGNSEAAK
jgi:hypothetical protein